MIYYLESDYIIANLLQNKQIGEIITIKDIVEYKETLTQKFRENDIHLVVDITDESILSTLDYHSNLFKIVGEDIYKISKIDIADFNKYLPNKLVEILKQ